MKIIKPSIEILSTLDESLLKDIETAGRTCYKSEDKITEGSDKKFVKGIIKRNHTAMLEFADITVRFICDRGVSHEIVRHRHFSFAQESTRYCKYSDGKFGSELTFIEPCFWEDEGNERNVLKAQKRGIWKHCMQDAEDFYLRLIEVGATPNEARSVLPNSLKTEIVVKGNFREWRHFFKLRCDKAAHIQMREVAKMALKEFYNRIPIVFDDLYEKFIGSDEYPYKYKCPHCGNISSSANSREELLYYFNDEVGYICSKCEAKVGLKEFLDV